MARNSLYIVLPALLLTGPIAHGQEDSAPAMTGQTTQPAGEAGGKGFRHAVGKSEYQFKVHTWKVSDPPKTGAAGRSKGGISRSQEASPTPSAPLVTPGGAARNALNRIDPSRSPAPVAARPPVSRVINPQPFPEQTRHSDDRWGSVITDIARHLPENQRYQDAFLEYTKEGDLVTAGHEWTHFLNEHLALKSGGGTSSYYVLENRFVTLVDPEGLRGFVPEVPSSLRGDLYDLYLVQNGGNARINPLYLFDEWSAYTNDLTVALDQLNRGKPLNPFHPESVQPKTAGNVLEFMFYGFALGMAVKQHDPGYFASENGRKLCEFIAWNALRSIDTYQKGLQHRELNDGDSRPVSLARNFRDGADTAEMRAWVKTHMSPEVNQALTRVVGASLSEQPAPTKRVASAS